MNELLREGNEWYADPNGAQTAPTPLAPTGRKRHTGLWALVAAGAAAATVTVVLVARSSDSGSSFCADYATLGNATQTVSSTGGSAGDLYRIIGMVHHLVDEAPTAARPDLVLLEKDLSTLAATGTPTMSDEAVQALADHIDAVAARSCGA